MNTIESFDINVPAGQTQNIEIQPSYKFDIIGFCLGTTVSVSRIKASLVTANSETILNNVNVAVLGNRVFVEWKKSYIPTNIPSQRLFLRIENGESMNFVNNFILIYNAKNPI